MLEYDRLDVSEGIDANKNQWSTLVHYLSLLVFSRNNLTFQPEVCNDCLDLMQKTMICNDVSIVSVKVSDYGIHF